MSEREKDEEWPWPASMLIPEGMRHHPAARKERARLAAVMAAGKRLAALEAELQRRRLEEEAS
jgi:hypothetical protein